MFVVIASKPASPGPQDILALFHTTPIISGPIVFGLVIATIVGVALIAWAGLRARRPRHPGSKYAFPKRRPDRDILRALSGATPTQTAILQYIVDGYLEGVDAADVARHLGIRRNEASKHLKTLHKAGLLYMRKCRGDCVFYLIESVMARVGEPAFFTMIGLTGLA